MLFTLEALEAKEGDSLLLHWGDPADPRLIVIDGGPSGVYDASLRPRLAELREAQDDPDDPLFVEQLMVSHIDGDHIVGVLGLTQDLIDADVAGTPPPVSIATLWHNSFDDIVGNHGADLLGAAGASVGAAGVSQGGRLGGTDLSRQSALVLASVGQGRQLRKNAERLGMNVNTPFGDLVTAPAEGRAVKELRDGLKLTVLGPDQARIDELQKKWDKDLPGLLAKEKPDVEAVAYLDKSAPNLSSIVVLAEADGKTMLLTGDALGSLVLEGLATAGFLAPGGSFAVDILKLPHHGSIRNVDTDFFERLPAKHYVVSANGKHGNPDLPTLEMISEVRTDDDFTLWITNREDRLDDFFAKEKAAGRKYRVVFREPTDRSVKVELGGDALDR